MKIANAFSLNMLNDLFCSVDVTILDKEEVVEMLVGSPPQSYVGHQSTAAVMSHELGVDIPCNRDTLELLIGNELVVCQYRGPRLPEGATKLPDGAEMIWLHLKVRAQW